MGGMGSKPAGTGQRKRRMVRGRLRAWLPWLLFALLLVPTALRVEGYRERLSEGRFPDFRIFYDQAERAERGDPLYRTDREDFHLPGSQSYKFPPPVAALLSLLEGRPATRHAPLGIAVSLALLAAAFALLAAAHRPPLWRLLLALLVTIHWVPNFESLAALAVEPLILLLWVLALLLARRAHAMGAGAAIGAAGALKVYPAGLLIHFLLRRRWRALGGVLLGGAVTLALAGLVLPLRHAADYFLRVLPHLGGIALSTENLGLFGNAGRLAIGLVAGRERMLSESRRYLSILGDVDLPGVRPLALGMAIVVIVIALGVTFRVWRRGATLPASRSASLGTALTISFYLPLLPSSWAHYQQLLLLPLLVAFFHAPAPHRAPTIWLLLAAGAIPGLWITDTHAFYRADPLLASALRSLIPFWIWWALLRIRAVAGRTHDATSKTSVGPAT
ncbi:MAG: DUF2029 domain-containing protein [Candidatus Eisenbacteria bacterium]|nr:DUF2029 domain-containing protein [Candidatus Eisenbacteria bacterium]